MLLWHVPKHDTLTLYVAAVNNDVPLGFYMDIYFTWILNMSTSYVAQIAACLCCCCRMPDGRLAALKVADDPSDLGETLDYEAWVLLHLQQEWGKWVPPLLAAGPDKDRESFVLAVERVPNCSHLDPGSDSDLLPLLQRALCAIHSHGVAHKDIRCENILVQKLPDGSKKPWLIDFGLSVLNATKKDKDRDLERLHGLFDPSP